MLIARMLIKEICTLLKSRYFYILFKPVIKC